MKFQIHFHRQRGKYFTNLLTFFMLSLCFLFSSLQAATISVCPFGCDQPTIAAGINTANAGDTVLIKNGVYTESGLTIDKNLTIQGEGKSTTIIQAAATQAAATTRVFRITGAASNVCISDLTIKNGNTSSISGIASKDGGGILHEVSQKSAVFLKNIRVTLCTTNRRGGCFYTEKKSVYIHVEGCQFDENTSDSGGAFFLGGKRDSLFIGNSLFTENDAHAPNIKVQGDSAVIGIDSSTFSHNTGNVGGCINVTGRYCIAAINHTLICDNEMNSSGGGIAFTSQYGILSIKGTTIKDNSASSSGGGLYLLGTEASVHIQHSSILKNEANFGAGIYYLCADGWLHLQETLINDNEAHISWGGIYDGTQNSFLIENTTLINNKTQGHGAGASMAGNGTFLNCTIARNIAEKSGGGISASFGDSLKLIHCTLTENKAGDNYNGGGLILQSTTLELINSIIANNEKSGPTPSADDLYQDFGDVLITNSLVEHCINCTTTPTFSSDPNLLPFSTTEIPLAYKLQCPSDALNAGSITLPNLPPADILGNPRKTPADLGAVESSLADFPPPTAKCQDITVQLNAQGIAAFSASDIDDGSSDACGITGLSLDKSSLDCSAIGKLPAWEALGGPGISIPATTNHSMVVASDGTPYLAYLNASSYAPDTSLFRRTTVLRWDGSSWNPVGGPTVSNEKSSRSKLAIAPDGTLYVAYQSQINGGLITILQLQGNTWTPLGNSKIPCSLSSQHSLQIGFDGIPYLAYTEDLPAGTDRLTVRKWDGSAWVTVGSPAISPAKTEDPDLACSYDGKLYVAFEDWANASKATVLCWDGNTWNPLGGYGVSPDEVQDIQLSLSPQGVPYLAFGDRSFGTQFNNYSELTVMKWTGTQWEIVGTSGISDGWAPQISLAISQENKPMVAFVDHANGSKLTVVEWNGSNWYAIGGKAVSTDIIYSIGLATAPNGAPYVAFQDYGASGRSTVFNWQGDNFVTLTATSGSAFSASCRAWVQVEDNVAPTIQLIGDDVLHICEGNTYTDPGATVTDNCDNGQAVSNPQIVNTAIPGDYTITYNFTDFSGNAAATVTRMVIVDPIPPILAQQGCGSCGQIRSTICQYEPAPDLQVLVLSNPAYVQGAVINWYADNNGSKGQPLANPPSVNPNQVATHFYWVEQQLGDCPGPAIRLRSKVKKLFTPVFNLPAIGCTGGQIDLAAWVSDPKNKATAYTFYDVDPAANSSATPLGSVSATQGVVNYGENLVIPLVNGSQTYWVQSTVPNGCGGIASSTLIAPIQSATLDFIPDLTVNNGDQVHVNFSGQHFTQIVWVNFNGFGNPYIGLLGSMGLGRLSFTAYNESLSPISATIRVISYNGNCAGEFQDFTITVLPFGPSRQSPANRLQFTGKRINAHDVQLDWAIQTEAQLLRFEIEKKRNDDEFEGIGEENWIGDGNYSFVDQTGMGNVNSYRLKLVFADGHIVWSDEVELIWNYVNNNRFTAFPNPSAGPVNIKALFPLQQNFSWQLFDNMGKVLKAGEMNSQQMQISRDNLAEGIYHLILTSPNGKQYLMKLILL